MYKKKYSTENRETYSPSWEKLLHDAIFEEGAISTAYSAFWNYPPGNQMAAFFQCLERGIKPGPISTYKKWTDLGRFVKKGEKAIWLCQPFLAKKEDEKTGELIPYTVFKWKPSWFVLDQTDGEEFNWDNHIPPAFSKDTLLEKFQIVEKPFDELNGNIQGYARKREIRINPIADHPFETLIHEVAHILLGHTMEPDFKEEGFEKEARFLCEVEAEAVSLIICESLGKTANSIFSRGYIQGWFQRKEEIPEKNAQRIFKVASDILRAGRGEKMIGEDSKPDYSKGHFFEIEREN
jgi:antirestriction protein ArdC